jgi:hypothetical protein
MSLYNGEVILQEPHANNCRNVFHISRYSIMYHQTKHRGERDNFLSFAVFPIRDANFVEIEYQFGYTSLYILEQILNHSLQKRSRYLQALLFLWPTCCLDYFIRIPKNEGIYPSSSRFDSENER